MTFTTRIWCALLLVVSTRDLNTSGIPRSADVIKESNEGIDVLLLLFVWILLCCPPPISVLLRFMIAMIYAEIIRTSRVDWLIQEGRLEDHDGTDDFSMGASPPFPLNPAFKNARYGQN